MRFLLLLLLAAALSLAQNVVTIHVDAAETIGPFHAAYTFFGYDEPNNTYTKNGRQLVGELAALSRTPVHIRTHFLLATGDGTPGLKSGYTNTYVEDASGRPVYDWSIIDRIFDTYLQAGAKPFVEIGFMPRALSSKPDPYHVAWIPGASNSGYFAGWSYPPRDYHKWSELIYQWVKHSVAKYGKAEVGSWYWEVWNEPDIPYWHGTPDEYDKLYDFTAAAVKRALPSARIGGPATTGPSSPRAAAFLRQFLEHCDSGRNSATGGTGAPLDFITYHAKGRTAVVDGHVRMGIAQEAQDVDQGYAIVGSFPKFSHLPIVLSECDPEGCAACPSRVYPKNAYRNGAQYASYTAAIMNTVLTLADRRKANVAGMLTWAFEFEGQPYFDGFRTLATNGIDKPVLNLFRMAGLMQGDRVKTESTGRTPIDAIRAEGVRGHPDIDALAARTEGAISVLLWNYQDDDLPGAAGEIRLEIAGVPRSAARVLLRRYRIDATHSNAWTAWKTMGSPQHPTPEQYSQLEQAGQLQLSDSPRWVNVTRGGVKLRLSLPRQAVSLVELNW